MHHTGIYILVIHSYQQHLGLLGYCTIDINVIIAIMLLSHNTNTRGVLITCLWTATVSYTRKTLALSAPNCKSHCDQYASVSGDSWNHQPDLYMHVQTSFPHCHKQPKAAMMPTKVDNKTWMWDDQALCVISDDLALSIVYTFISSRMIMLWCNFISCEVCINNTYRFMYCCVK